MLKIKKNSLYYLKKLEKLEREFPDPTINLVHVYPNALLAGDNTPLPIPLPKPVEAEKTPNIWDIIDKIKKDGHTNIIALGSKICVGCQSYGTLMEAQGGSMIVCSTCGMVNDELLDHGPEWRQYYNEDGRNESVNRCGCPSNFFFPKSSQGTIMAGSSSSRLKRKQKWNSTVYKERSLNHVFEKISSVCAANSIPKIIVDSAKIFYKKISDCKHSTGNPVIIRGYNRESIIAACVFKACEINKNPRTTREIADYFGLDEKKISKGNKQFEKIIKGAEDHNSFLDQFDPSTAEDYVARHCPKLKIGKNNTALAATIAHNCCKMKLASDHNPRSVAAGSILLMVHYCNINIDKKMIAKLFKTSDVTISKIYNKLLPFADALVSDDITNHLIKKFKING